MGQVFHDFWRNHRILLVSPASDRLGIARSPHCRLRQWGEDGLQLTANSASLRFPRASLPPAASLALQGQGGEDGLQSAIYAKLPVGTGSEDGFPGAGGGTPLACLPVCRPRYLGLYISLFSPDWPPPSLGSKLAPADQSGLQAAVIEDVPGL